MEPVLTVLPELEPVGDDPLAAPPRRSGHRTVAELGGEGGHPVVQLAPRPDRPALMGGVCRDLAAAGAAGEVLVGGDLVGPHHRSFDPDLPGDGLPVEQQGGVRIVLQFMAFAAVVVGEEHEPVRSPRLEQRHPGRGPAEPVGGGHRHRLGNRQRASGTIEPAPELHHRIGVDTVLEQGLGWFEHHPTLPGRQ